MDDMRKQFLDLDKAKGAKKLRGELDKLLGRKIEDPGLDLSAEGKLRGELDKLLGRKIEDPGLDLSAEGKGLVVAAVELLHRRNTRGPNTLKRWVE